MPQAAATAVESEIWAVDALPLAMSTVAAQAAQATSEVWSGVSTAAEPL
jgi:hypothetical protein